MDLYKLQNGSDIRGVAMEGIEGENVNFTLEAAEKIAAGFALWLKEEKGIISPVVSVGTDSRITSHDIAMAAVTGLNGAECSRVYYFGLASTPAMFVSTKESTLNCDGAIMISASHLPFNRNGMKFFTKQGGTDKNDIKKILNFAENFTSNTYVDNSYEQKDFISEYSAILVDFIREKTACSSPLEGLKVIVDAGGGAGGFFVDKVLKTLGADTTGSVFTEPDGYFRGHVPNPENEKVMVDFCEVVKKEKADLGVIFDTDVDRSAIVDGDGTPISRNKLIALISDILLKENPGATIVTDSVTSKSLTPYITNRGGVHHRFMRGYNNVIKEGKRLCAEGINCPIAIETSGHCALRENDFLDDGAYLIVKLLINYCNLRKEGLTFSDMLKDYEDPKEAMEIRPKLLEEDFKAQGERIISDFRQKAIENADWSLEEPNYEGVRVNVPNGWILIRLSLHDPVLPINIETEKEGTIDGILAELKEFLGGYELEF
ncbi:MAG: phosphomannomutase/phosphoglucomutase [Anaerofustis stercorihominis]|nr:phosphomannomutase/phosphoglucomutase [Anaerofustis stercorihominis]